MARKVFVFVGIIGVFSLGALGGLWAQVLLLPYLSSQDFSRNWQFVKDWSERTIVIRETNEVVITKEEAVAKVAAQAERVIAGIESSNGRNVLTGSGFIVTSDGFILTLASVVPEGYTPTVYTDKEQEGFSARVLKRDIQTNLVVLKVEERNMPTTSFASADSWKIGDSVVMVARVREAGELITIVQEGTVRTKETESVRTNIVDKRTLGGSPLFNLEGQVVGLSTFEPSGRLVAIPEPVLREFAGF